MAIQVSDTAPSIKVDPKNVAKCGGDVKMAYLLHLLIELSDPNHTGEFTPVIITSSEMSKLTGLARDSIQRTLNHLRIAGYLDWSGRIPGHPSAYTPKVNLLVNR